MAINATTSARARYVRGALGVLTMLYNSFFLYVKDNGFNYGRGVLEDNVTIACRTQDEKYNRIYIYVYKGTVNRGGCGQCTQVNVLIGGVAINHRSVRDLVGARYYMNTTHCHTIKEVERLAYKVSCVSIWGCVYSNMRRRRVVILYDWRCTIYSNYMIIGQWGY